MHVSNTTGWVKSLSLINLDTCCCCVHFVVHYGVAHDIEYFNKVCVWYLSQIGSYILLPYTEMTLMHIGMVAVVGPSLLLRDWDRSGKVWSWCCGSQWCFGINFSEPRPKLPFCLTWFYLIATLPLFVSPGFSVSQRFGVLNQELQLG